MFLINYISNICGCPQARLDKATYCHGTTFSTLYLICKQAGDEQNCLLPFGKLANRRVPVFAGECASETACLGIRDKGINEKHTSWNWILKYSDSLDRYAKKYPFDVQKTKEKMNTLIKEFRDYNGGFPPYDSTTYGWNNVSLQMRQLRAWDEEEFQRVYASDLKDWVRFAISDFKEKINIEDYESILAKMRNFEEELSQPVAFRATKIDQENIKKNFPILFITDQTEDYIPPKGNEVGFSRNMQLGREIKWIATEPKNVEEVRSFIRQKNLANRVSVISTEVLKKKYH